MESECDFNIRCQDIEVCDHHYGHSIDWLSSFFAVPNRRVRSTCDHVSLGARLG